MGEREDGRGEGRTGAATHLLLVLASAAAVWVVLVAPTVLARLPVSTTPPGPTALRGGLAAVEGPGSRDWDGLGCARRTCPVPARLDLHGRTFAAGAGTHQRVHRDDVSTRTLRWTVRLGTRQQHWVLVGAEGSSSASDLTVQLGSAALVSVPSGRLTLLEVPPDGRSVQVSLVEGGRSGAETLWIQEYALSVR